MNSIQGFNHRRFFLLTRNGLFLGRSLILIFSLAMGGMVIVLATLSGKHPDNIIFDIDLCSIFYYLTLYTVGFILTGNIFEGLHHETRGAAWLTLPASNLEKFISKLATTTIIFTIGIMMLFFLISLFSEWLIRFIWGPGHSHGLFNPLNRMIMLNTLLYLILQSIFFLGGVYFKTHAVIRTILSMAIYFFIFITIVGLTGKILFNEFLFLPDFLYNSSLLNGPAPGLTFENVIPIGPIIRLAAYIGFWYVLAPLCWLIGYYRLIEKEV